MSGEAASEQVVLVPRGGKTHKQAYAVAAERLEKLGYKARRLVSFTVDRDYMTGAQTFLLRIEVETAE